MKDEEYVYFSDVSEKAITRRSARNKRTHCGKGGKVRMPSDYLTKKELEKMSGECASFRLNEPMTWAEFKAMPDDIKIMYIKLLKEKWKVPNAHIGKMLGVSEEAFSKETHRLGIGRGHGGRIYWDKDAFYKWVAGSRGEAAEEPVAEEVVEEPVEEVVEEPDEEATEIVLNKDKYFTFKIDDDAVPKGVETAVPERGELVFKCPASLALETVKSLLDNQNVEIRIAWRVIDGQVC